MDANGAEMDKNPGIMPEQKVPDALIQAIALSREAVEDVANPGIPQDIADPDTSGRAVQTLDIRMDRQTSIYQKNFKHSKRRDAVIYASMASAVYVEPRRVTTVTPDGQQTEQVLMETVVDQQTGQIRVINDLTNTEFEAYAKIGPSYTSQREQTRHELSIMIQTMDPNDPMRQALMLKYIRMMDGEEFEDIRKYANRQLLMSGIKEPETEEEAMMLQQAQQQAAEQAKQPSPQMLLAQGEYMKGQAAMAREQLEVAKFQAEHQIDIGKLQIDGFVAETGRMLAQVKAAEVGAKIEDTRANQFGKKVDNTIKLADFRGKAVGDDTEANR